MNAVFVVGVGGNEGNGREKANDQIKGSKGGLVERYWNTQ